LPDGVKSDFFSRAGWAGGPLDFGKEQFTRQVRGSRRPKFIACISSTPPFQVKNLLCKAMNAMQCNECNARNAMQRINDFLISGLLE
jgi:hypothetical protein